MERQSRSIFKTLTWRIVATSTTLILVYIFTNNIIASAGVGITESVVKTIIYYMHERIWNKTNYGVKTIASPPLNSPKYVVVPKLSTDEQVE